MMSKSAMNLHAEAIGFRLQYLEVYNWGTFDKKIWRVEPDGNNSLLTGSIGSGKSTIVDALTSLIVPHHKITFNKAAGAESKERNLLSYIRGDYSSKSDELSSKGRYVSLRYKDESDMTFTVIVANFHNAGYEKDVTLAQVLWIQNDKPQKLLVISEKPLTIQEYFSNIESIEELKRKLKGHKFIQLFDDNFSKYSIELRHLMGMRTEKAIDLFYQTISMKSVDSLTEFVKKQMLEKTEIDEQINDLKKRFDDLNKAHEVVVKARRQKEILEPLVGYSKDLREIEAKTEEIHNIQNAIPGFFASRKINLLDKEIAQCKIQLDTLISQLTEIENELINKREIENQLNDDIENNGGKRLKEIDRDISDRVKDRDTKKKRYEQYTTLITLCDLATINDKVAFDSNIESAELKIEKISIANEKNQEQRGQLIADMRIIKSDIEKEKTEFESLKSRKNQIPFKILNLRKQLSVDLGINEQDIPFAGELLKVSDHEKDWEGAIERLLRPFGISLLVPEKHYPQISQYINRRKLVDNNDRGMRFEYHKVLQTSKTTNFHDISPDSVVNKVEIKTGSIFQGWLYNELCKRYDLRCVNTIEEFQKYKDVITKEGQIKTGESRHVKDDRRGILDRKDFVLGWTNTEKIKAIEIHIKELQDKYDKQNTLLSQLEKEIHNNNVLNTNLYRLKDYTIWDELNWKDEAKKIEELKKEKSDLENSNDKLKNLQEKLQSVKNEIQLYSSSQQQKLRNQGSIEAEIAGYKENIENSQKIANALKPAEIELFYPKIENKIMGSVLSIKNIDAMQNKLVTELTGRDGEKEKLSRRRERTRENILKVMKDYKEKFPSESFELSVEVEAWLEYVKIFNAINSDGLPNYESKFKKMLNENTIQDIAVFQNKLDSHEKEIKKKIEEINKHLKGIEYNPGTYITLLQGRNSDKDISDFKQELKDCFRGSINIDDAYTEDKFNKVKKILDRFSSNANSEIEWTKKVTDVRNWFVFNASERRLEDDVEKEFYAGASGKSGGQKEKLAYTILASALAYQFGLSEKEQKSKSFRFVVIDEAFGRGDDESTQFGLKLFKELHLQLLIVTPLQKIHVIENYINAVHYVSNISGRNSELQNLTIEEYRDEKYKYNTMVAEEVN